MNESYIERQRALAERQRDMKLASLDAWGEKLKGEYLGIVETILRNFAPRVDPSKLSTSGAPCPVAFDAAYDSLDDSDGLYLHGVAGGGKTSAVLSVIHHHLSVHAIGEEITGWDPIADWKRELRDAATTMDAADWLRDVCKPPHWYRRFRPEGVQLWAASELRDAFNEVSRDYDGKAKFRELIQTADYLLIDDLGHLMTPAFAENLRMLFDHWCGYRLFITSQYRLDELHERWSRKVSGQPDMSAQADALVRRIKALCTPIRFRIAPKKETTK